jgi:hypothetical protein
VDYTTSNSGDGLRRNDALPSAIVQAAGRSELQQETGTLTSEASAVLGGSIPLNSDNSLATFLTMYGTTYAVTSSNSLAEQSLGLITNLLDGYGIGGLQFGAPSALLRWNVAGGIARQSQTEQDQYGTIIRSELGAAAQSVGEGQLFQGSALLDERFFPNQVQRLSNDRVYGSLLTILPGDGTSGLSASGSLSRRDFYYTVDSSSPAVRQERRELSALLADSLEYPVIPSALTAQVNLTYQPRLITRTVDASTAATVLANGASLSSLIAPNDVSDLGLSAEGIFTLFGNHRTSAGADQPFSASASMRYEEHDENVTLRSSDIPSIDPVLKQKLAEELNQASYSSKVTQALVNTYYAVSYRDTLNASLGARILRYDTPDPTNHDDRDELLTNGNINLVHDFSRELVASIGARASRSHLVYLESDRSAQNNVMRTVALTTTTAYSVSNFTQSLYAEVFANYTVLDYADQLPQLATNGSYLLRGIDVHDTTIIRLPRLSPTLQDFLFFSGEVNILERGSYNDSAFSERPIANNTEVSAILTYGIRDQRGSAPFELQAGVRAFVLRRAGIDPTLLTNQTWMELERQVRIGPIASITLNRDTPIGPRLFADLWYSFVRISEQNSQTITYSHQVESHLSMQWSF